MENNETLEEVAENYATGKSSSDVFKEAHIRDFIAGAKWQAERMYSEEEVYKTLHNLMSAIKLQGLVINDDMDLKKWFEQFKKK